MRFGKLGFVNLFYFLLIYCMNYSFYLAVQRFESLVGSGRMKCMKRFLVNKDLDVSGLGENLWHLPVYLGTTMPTGCRSWGCVGELVKIFMNFGAIYASTIG